MNGLHAPWDGNEGLLMRKYGLLAELFFVFPKIGLFPLAAGMP